MSKRMTESHEVVPQLAQPGDPLVMPDGTVYDPLEIENDEQTQPALAQQTINPDSFKPTLRRVLSELPAEPKVINAVAAVFMYTVLGISDREICEATKLTRMELVNARKHPAYRECFENVVKEFINVNSSLLVARIAAHSTTAFSNVADIAQSRKVKPETRLRANQDILDRAGVRPKDNEQRQLVNKNELRIVIQKGTGDLGLELNGEKI